MLSLKNQVAVVTGSTGGIGSAVATDLARKKVKLCLVGRNAKTLKQQAQKLSAFSPKVRHCMVDFVNTEDIEKVSSYALSEFGTVNILIHCAGYLSMGSIENASLEDLDLHFKINYKAPYLLTKLLLPALKETHGQIVFVNSSAIQRAISDLTQYSSSKLALKGLADTVREVVNPYEVRVLSIYPGQTATSMQERIYKRKEKPYKPDNLLKPTDISSIVINSLTMPSTVEITEIFIRPMLKVV
jgi:NADP-dependent 3-hydroxy acid dehydrogenase YdfG